jgi:DNA modification methylase
MQVIQVPISKIRFAQYNPRKISDTEMASLKRSLQRFGFVDPVVVNRRRGKSWSAAERGTVIVGGHQRVRAARELGHKAVPVVYVDLSPDDEKLLNLALNKIGGEFDLPKLAEILRDLRKAKADLGASGFSQKEITRAIADAERELSASLPPDEEDVPDLPRKPRTQPGELIRLGPHRLLCGDSTKPEHMKCLMGGDRADLLWTDPPYGVDYVGKTARAMTIRNDGRRGLQDLLRTAFAAVDAGLEPGAAFYVAHPAGLPAVPFINAVLQTGWLVRQNLVWVKDTMVLGHSDYHYRHEAILYGYKPAAGRLGRGGMGWYGGEDQTSVFEIARPKASRDHPTMKPVALIEACVRNSSQREDVILDPFGGSGSTLIACHRLGRRAFLMEIDPRYCDVIRERWRRFTGQREGRDGRDQVA